MKLTKLSKVLAVLGLTVAIAACSSDNGASGSASSQVQAVESQFGFVSNDHLTTAQLLSIRTYYFEFDSSELKDVNLEAVKAQGQYLAAHPTQVVFLAGNTDIRGSREYNIGLGWRRAQSVAQMLKAQGVAAKQIVMQSYGAELPVATGNTEDDYSKNRRVDILYCTSANCADVRSSYAAGKSTN